MAPPKPGSGKVPKAEAEKVSNVGAGPTVARPAEASSSGVWGTGTHIMGDATTCINPRTEKPSGAVMAGQDPKMREIDRYSRQQEGPACGGGTSYVDVSRSMGGRGRGSSPAPQMLMAGPRQVVTSSGREGASTRTASAPLP